MHDYYTFLKITNMSAFEFNLVSVSVVLSPISSVYFTANFSKGFRQQIKPPIDAAFGHLKDIIFKIFDHGQMVEQWNDIIVSAHWTREGKGFFKVWANGSLAFSHQGKTKTKGKKIYQKFGVYQSFLSRYHKRYKVAVPGQVVCYDEV